MSKVEQVLECFKEGFSCSQAVFATYAKELGMEYEIALKVSQAFGGGVGGMGGECGAVTGAYMVISLIHGRTRAEDSEARLTTFRLVEEFSKRFKAIHGTSTCSNLLQGKEGTHYEKCKDYVRDASLILEDLLSL